MTSSNPGSLRALNKLLIFYRLIESNDFYSATLQCTKADDQWYEVYKCGLNDGRLSLKQSLAIREMGGKSTEEGTEQKINTRLKRQANGQTERHRQSPLMADRGIY